MGSEDDDMLFADEDTSLSPERKPWKVLIADDDIDVHLSTKLVFKQFVFQDREIEFLDSYSGTETGTVLRNNPDVAVVLLDVVMESDDAGLRAVKYIRGELANPIIRIILRTGQPGQAPEEQVIVDYDINDYKSKSEMTSRKLFTAMVSALRSFHDLQTIEASRKGLERVLEGSVDLLNVHSTERFLSGLLMQLQTMFHLGGDAVLCARSVDGSDAPMLEKPVVLAGTGTYENITGTEVENIEVPEWKQDIQDAFENGRGGFKSGNLAIYFYSREAFEIVILFAAQYEPSAFDNTLIDVFCRTAAVSLSNVHLMETLERKVIERTALLSKANEDLLVMASTDALTGTYNRGYLFDAGSRSMNTARRYQRPLTVIILDVDHFKAINDTHGHAVGDVILKAITRICLDVLRKTDIFGRYGGEEFVALLPETDLAGAIISAERLRTAVESLVSEGADASIRVTISLGVTNLSSADNEIAQTIQRADKALYQAKTQGRNRAVALEGGN
jgi:diguanylate cyclase (GGDEF)-like protein